jgi:hypothetical protein
MAFGKTRDERKEQEWRQIEHGFVHRDYQRVEWRRHDGEAKAEASFEENPNRG